MKSKRVFQAALQGERCEANIRWSDGTGSQCARAKVIGHWCRQHARMDHRTCGCKNGVRGGACFDYHPADACEASTKENEK